MVEFIDKTETQGGTPINRANMMALQGFKGKTVSVSADGKTIVETNDDGHTLTTTISNTTVTEVFVGTKTIKRTLTFNSDGSVTEVIS